MSNTLKYYFSCVTGKDTCVLATIATSETIARTLLQDMTSDDVKIGEVIKIQKVPIRQINSMLKVRSI